MSEKKIVGLIGCMDEANLLPGEIDGSEVDDLLQIYFGIAGSGYATRDRGDLKKLPSEVRELFVSAQGGVFFAINWIMEYLGGKLYGSSHDGCAWASLNGARDVAGETQAMFTKHAIPFAGHITYGNVPVQLDGTPVYASIGRAPVDHKHVANGIVVSVGGGITGRELKELGGDPFIIDASFAAIAVAYGRISQEDAIRFVAAQIDTADGIMDGRIGASIDAFDAKRLEPNMASYNKLIFDLAVASLTR